MRKSGDCSAISGVRALVRLVSSIVRRDSGAIRIAVTFCPSLKRTFSAALCLMTVPSRRSQYRFLGPCPVRTCLSNSSHERFARPKALSHPARGSCSRREWLRVEVNVIPAVVLQKVRMRSSSSDDPVSHFFRMIYKLPLTTAPVVGTLTARFRKTWICGNVSR